MSSRRKDYQQDVKSRVLRTLTLNPEITSWQIAQQVGISNGSANYLLISLIGKGYVKLKNFKQNPKKVEYSYLLT
jgi:predicted ArsR family transcriptional regulator